MILTRIHPLHTLDLQGSFLTLTIIKIYNSISKQIPGLHFSSFDSVSSAFGHVVCKPSHVSFIMVLWMTLIGRERLIPLPHGAENSDQSPGTHST